MIHFGLEGVLPLLLYVAMFVTFALSVLWRPSVGVYMVALTLPLQTGRFQLHQFPLGPQFLDIVLLGSVLGLIRRGESLIPKTGLKRLFLIFAAFSYVSLWQGSLFIDAPPPLWISDERFSNWKNYVEMFMFAMIVASAIKEKKQVGMLFLLMGASVLVVNRSFFSIMSDRDLSHFSYQVRDAGPLGYAGVNGLAAFEAMVVSFVIGFYSCIKNWRPKIAILIIAGTCVYCLLFSFSRGGYIALLAGMVTVGLFKPRWLLVPAAVVLLAWLNLLPTSVEERITMTTEGAIEGQQFEPSTGDRLVLWQDALDLFKANPIAGTGFDTYASLGRVGGYRDTHNYYMKVLAEMGILGFLLYLFLLWRMVRSGLRLFRGTGDRLWQGIGLGFMAMVASIIVANLFGDRWTYQQVDGYLWIVLGCVIRGSIALVEQREDASLLHASPVGACEPRFGTA